MDLIRYGAMDYGVVRKAADQIIDIGRRLVPYIRAEEKAQELLLFIIGNKQKKGRLFSKNKDDEIVGGFNNRWTGAELTTLRYALTFVCVYYAPLRYEMTQSPLSSSNINKIWRVYKGLILLEELDFIFLNEFKERGAKAIKDKLKLCAASEDYTNSIVIEIKNILVKKLGINDFRKEPSSGLFFTSCQHIYI